MAQKIKHSDEWWEGYNYQGVSRRNPYRQDNPDSAQFFKDWYAGWSCRFHGEDPYQLPPSSDRIIS